MNTPTIIAIVILVVLLLSCLVMGYIATHGYRQSLDESWNWQMDNVPYLRGTIDRSEFINYTVSDKAGYTYHVAYLPARCDSDKFVILAHGYTDTRFGMLKYMNFYRDMGFHCIFFDERGHGENKRVSCSYGPKEVKGLLTVLDDSIARYGSHIKIGFHGESLGGATVLFSYGYELPGNVRFIVDDCGFAKIMPIIAHVYNMMHLPGFLNHLASIGAGLLYWKTLYAAAPVKKVANPKHQTPLLIIHGAADDFITPANSQMVYDAFSGYSEIHFVDNAPHAHSAITNPSEYRRFLQEFFDHINFWN